MKRFAAIAVVLAVVQIQADARSLSKHAVAQRVRAVRSAMLQIARKTDLRGAQLRGAIHKSLKRGGEVLSQFDRRIERSLCTALGREFPHDGFAGEELGRKTTKSGVTWHIDPIDGTYSLINGEATYAMSVGASHRGKLLLGAVYEPATDTLFVTARGKRPSVVRYAASQTRRARRIPRNPGHDAALEDVVVTANLGANWTSARATLAELYSQGKVGKLISPLGSPALALATMLVNRPSVLLFGLRERSRIDHDVAAGVLLVRQAGGVVTHLDGRPWRLGDNTDALLAATTRSLHREALQRFSKLRRDRRGSFAKGP